MLSAPASAPAHHGGPAPAARSRSYSAKSDALTAEYVSSRGVMPCRNAPAPSRRNVERASESAPGSATNDAARLCSRTFTTSNGCSATTCTAPATQPAMAAFDGGMVQFQGYLLKLLVFAPVLATWAAAMGHVHNGHTRESI